MFTLWQGNVHPDESIVRVKSENSATSIRPDILKRRISKQTPKKGKLLPHFLERQSYCPLQQELRYDTILIFEQDI